MDTETKEYLDRKFLGLATRDDLERLRQEIRAGLRKLKEEEKAEALEKEQRTRAGLEDLGRRWVSELSVLRQELREGLRRLESAMEPQSPAAGEIIEASFRALTAETGGALDRLQQELTFLIRSNKEEEAASRNLTVKEARSDLDRLAETFQAVSEQMNRTGVETATLHEKIRGDLAGVKEELGAMMKFSFADLEKRINDLESKIKALEKMVFH